MCECVWQRHHQRPRVSRRVSVHVRSRESHERQGRREVFRRVSRESQESLQRVSRERASLTRDRDGERCSKESQERRRDQQLQREREKDRGTHRVRAVRMDHVPSQPIHVPPLNPRSHRAVVARGCRHWVGREHLRAVCATKRVHRGQQYEGSVPLRSETADASKRLQVS